MERLTSRDEFGNADIIGVNSSDLQSNLSFDEFNRVTEALNRLAMYEDFQEKEKLKIFPCKLGDTAFWISEEDKDGNDIPTIHETKPIDGIAYKEDGIYIHNTDGEDWEWNKIGEQYALLTRKQAEQFLESGDTHV